jgi:hypothetical protein
MEKKTILILLCTALSVVLLEVLKSRAVGAIRSVMEG